MVRNKATNSGGDSATGIISGSMAIGLIIPYLYDEAGRVKEATGTSKNVTTIYTIEYACK